MDTAEVASRAGKAHSSPSGLASDAVTQPQRAEVFELPSRPPRRPLSAAFAALRPRQWTKNLLLFAGIIFAAQPGRFDRALAAFAIYCAASSAAYLFNDLRDLPHDRVHPVKRLRPLPHGDLSVRVAVALAAAAHRRGARRRSRARASPTSRSCSASWCSRPATASGSSTSCSST